MAYSGMFVFGDSLVDPGNALKASLKYASLPFTKLPEGAPTAEKGYFAGRFSDGYTFADLIANKAIGSVTKPVFPFGFEDPWFGIPLDPFGGDPSGNNLNFAYGGARIRRGDEVVPPLDGQTDAFRDAVDGHADPGALYMVTMGGNDVRGLAPDADNPASVTTAYSALTRAANKMIEELGQLVNVGARHLLITGVPDVGIIPKYDVDRNLILDPSEQLRSAAATHFSAYLDSLIRTRVTPALESRGATVTYVPLASFGNSAEHDVKGALDASLSTLAPLHGLTPEQVSGNWLRHQDLVFFDDVHPNGQAHAVVGSYLYAQLTDTAWIETLPLTGNAVAYRMSGQIATAGEVDQMSIALARGTTYSLEMLGVSSLGTAGTLGDTALRLRDATGALVAADDDSGAGFDARLDFTATANGTHTLELMAAGSLTGSYVMQASVTGAAALGGNTYVIDNAATLVIESAGAPGVDVVATTVNYTLGAGSEVEVLKTINWSAPISLTGNSFDQTLIGNNYANRLDGRGGNDVLWGLGGADTFLFRSAPSSGVDTIMDFDARQDVIGLDHAIFGGIRGALPAEWFHSGPAALDPDDRIIFDPLTRTLSFDADGSGPGEAILFARLQGPDLNFDAGDFILV